MTNYEIADQFALLAKLMDIHGENAFKAKSYASAAFTIEKLPLPLAGSTEEQISKIKNIGDSAGKKIAEIIKTGSLKLLQDLLQQTPEGVLEMMSVKGLGPKKIYAVWKELGIDTMDELEKACRENRLATAKGFGRKTEEKILESIEFVHSNKGKFLYKDVEDFVTAIAQKLEAKFPDEQTGITGEFRRQLEIISVLEWVTTATRNDVKNFLVNEQMTVFSENDQLLILCGEDFPPLHFHFATQKTFAKTLITTTGNEEFLEAFVPLLSKEAETENDFFAAAGLPFIPPFLRENKSIIEKARNEALNEVVQINTIRGLIHSHSNWSDGSYTIEQMADELIQLGFEYLVISDHSKAAAYASGLSAEKIKEQHQLINALNVKLAPFKIFKSIECDILGDGELDYEDATLASFDLVIASVHSNLDMEEDKAMMRLMGAIKNPYTTILGHLTGRLLLRRKGYPINHKAIIDACAVHHVAIEINASPYRLDMDWRWIPYAMEKGVLLSINPDAHGLEDFPYIKYGTLVAQKGGLPTRSNISSFSLKEFEDFLSETKRKKGIS